MTINEQVFLLLIIPSYFFFSWHEGTTSSKVVKIVTALLSNHFIARSSTLSLTQIFISPDPLPFWHSVLSLDRWQFLNLLPGTVLPIILIPCFKKVVANGTPVYQLLMNIWNHWCRGICWSNCVTIFPEAWRSSANIGCTSIYFKVENEAFRTS